MHELHIRRIKTFLHKEFGDLIDLSDVSERDDNEIENHFLTRSQAALALSHLADLDKNIAAESIIDGFDDNGIDAIYFDEVVKTIYLVQSKWVEKGNKGPDLGSIEKFISGFNDLVRARFDRFNSKIKDKQARIETALDSTDVNILLIIVYTGTQPLSSHAELKLNDLLEEINDPVDVVSYRSFNQKDIYHAISGTLENAFVNIDVTLHDWGQIRDPYQAYYGQVSAEEIARWYREHNSHLFARNLRKFKGDTEVNLSIRKTLLQEPFNFWYFNNGITILCNKISKKPIGGTTRDMGQFTCEGVSVVNGAQTVGSIATSVSQGFLKAKDAKVLVKFISLENCPPEFAADVTTATNTQNRIEKRDFASLDPTQERLRQDLLLDMDKLYVYKSGEKIISQRDGCDIEEAIIALACAYPNVRMAADAKRNIGMLWADIYKPPYSLLFNDKLTALRLWRSVQVSREVELFLEKERETLSGSRRMICVHGNRFILHRVFRFLPLEKFDNANLDMAHIILMTQDHTEKTIDQIHIQIEMNYKEAYLNTFFKNGSKCIELDQVLPTPPPIPQIPYFKSHTDPYQPSLFGNHE